MLGSADNTTPRFSLTVHTSDVDVGETGDEDVFGAPVDSVEKNQRDREASMLPVDPQKYNHEKTLLTNSQIDEMSNPLRAVFQKHEDELTESLKSRKDQYRWGL